MVQQVEETETGKAAATIEGRFEAVIDGRAIGWAWDPGRPGEAVEVEIEVDGRSVARGAADVERPALADAGIGQGRHGFDISLPESLTESASHKIRVLAGQNRTDVVAVESFSTVVRSPADAWNQTTFTPEGRSAVAFVPEKEEPPDPGDCALIGKDRWLFLRDDRNLTLSQLRGRRLLSRKEIEGRQEALTARHARLRELGIPTVVAVVPMKERVYGELLPDGVHISATRPVTQINAALRDVNGGALLDLLPDLRRARRHGEVFNRTDSRWNHRGAFFGYRALLKEASKAVISLEPLLPAEATFVRVPGFRGDLAGKPKVSLVDDGFVEDADHEQWEEDVDEVDASTLRARRMPAPEHLEVSPTRAPHLYEIADAEELPRAVVLGDSSCLQLIPWLAEHFQRLAFLWTSALPLEAIELEMPDVLFHVVTERFLISRDFAGS